jgi:hypothetical protein
MIEICFGFLWWTTKVSRDLILVFLYHNEIKIKIFWFISNEVHDLWTFYLMKIRHIFSKVHFILKKTWFILKFYNFFLINELYKNENINGKKSLHLNTLLLFDYPKKTKKNWLKKIPNKMDFEILRNVQNQRPWSSDFFVAKFCHFVNNIFRNNNCHTFFL